jgi:hypothetical protein
MSYEEVKWIKAGDVEESYRFHKKAVFLAFKSF